MNEYVAVLKKYATFSGRASRKEYWMFFLINVLISLGLGFVLGVIEGATGHDVSGLAGIYNLALFIPSIAVACRRCHDTDRSGWWLLVPIVGFVLMFFRGQDSVNRFGEIPEGSPSYAGAPVAVTSSDRPIPQQTPPFIAQSIRPAVMKAPESKTPNENS